MKAHTRTHGPHTRVPPAAAPGAPTVPAPRQMGDHSQWSEKESDLRDQVEKKEKKRGKGKRKKGKAAATAAER